jgi:hypothetical protein
MKSDLARVWTGAIEFLQERADNCNFLGKLILVPAMTLIVFTGCLCFTFLWLCTKKDSATVD